MKLTLRGARVNAKKTVKEIAEKLGVTTQTVYNWEQGITQPKMQHTQQLAELYNIKVDDFK